MEIASWGGHRFEVRPGLIRSFTEMTLRGSAETEEKVSDNQKYVERKAGNGWEMTLTAVLSAYLGCSVRDEAIAFANDAKESRSEYFYMAGKKLVPEKLMLTEATVQDVEIAPDGVWVRANVQLILKQAEKGEGGGTGSASNSTGTKKTGSASGSSGKGNAQDGSQSEKDSLKDKAKSALLKSRNQLIAKAKAASGGMITKTKKNQVMIAHE